MEGFGNRFAIKVGRMKLAIRLWRSEDPLKGRRAIVYPDCIPVLLRKTPQPPRRRRACAIPGQRKEMVFVSAPKQENVLFLAFLVFFFFATGGQKGTRGRCTSIVRSLVS